MRYGLLVLLLLLPVSAHAGACLSIDVPPHVVVNVRDGDTFSLFTFAPGGQVNIRVQGVDTPELNSSGFEEAKRFTKDWLSRGPFTVSTCGKSTFDRIVGIVERDGQTLADALIKAGLTK